MKKLLIALLVLSNFSTAFAVDNDAWAKQSKANELRRAKEAKTKVPELDRQFIKALAEGQSRGPAYGLNELQHMQSQVQQAMLEARKYGKQLNPSMVTIWHVIDGKNYQGSYIPKESLRHFNYKAMPNATYNYPHEPGWQCAPGRHFFINYKPATSENPTVE